MRKERKAKRKLPLEWVESIQFVQISIFKLYFYKNTSHLYNCKTNKSLILNKLTFPFFSSLLHTSITTYQTYMHTAIYSMKVSRRVRWKTNIFYVRKEDLFNFWASCSFLSWFLSFLAISIVCERRGKKDEKIVWKFIAAFPFSDFLFFFSSYFSSSYSNFTRIFFLFSLSIPFKRITRKF